MGEPLVVRQISIEMPDHDTSRHAAGDRQKNATD
jgi:hypothetical protein